jgi:nucleoside-diphosphate-sugar epimerase
MDYRLPGLILTGASGFVGRNFIKAAADTFRLFCVGRRSMEEAGVQGNSNLRWTQVDIADWVTLKDLIQRVKDHGGADYILHLAGYYDFTNREHPSYTRTNVEGTKNMLELARQLEIRRFIFASSQAACPFDTIVNEESPPDADLPYARSKRAGEELVRAYARWFPCATVRIAAVFSDWCEYPPLYTLLNNWLSDKLLESRILAGKGQSAIPYIHVHDLVQFFLQVIDKSDELEQHITLNAGPDGTTTHLELFRIATQYHYAKPHNPFFLNKHLLVPMILARRLLSRLRGKEAFEQLWMLDYVDKQLVAKNAKTRNILAWEPTPRKTITRRLVFLIENMQKNPDLWQTWNEAMLHKTHDRPYLVLHQALGDILENIRDRTIAEITTQLLDTEQQAESPGVSLFLNSMRREVAHTYLRLLYQLIVTIMLTNNRPMMRQYALIIALQHMETGISKTVESYCLYFIGEFLIYRLRLLPELRQHAPGAEEYIPVVIHMAIDQIEDQAELLRMQNPRSFDELEHQPPPDDPGPLEEVVSQLEELCREAISGQSWTSPLYVTWANERGLPF